MTILASAARRLGCGMVLAFAATAGILGARTALVSAASQIVQPGAPGESSREISAEQAVASARIRPSSADIQFVQGMILHHAQALEMTALIKRRTTTGALASLGARIEISQRDEIAMMQEWLRSHGLEVPDLSHHAHGAAPMPGMLTADEMAQLAAATGAAFDRLFLESMIKHHTGALLMVKTLFAQPAGVLAPEIFAFATDVDADQRSEIDRMRAMLAK